MQQRIIIGQPQLNKLCIEWLVMDVRLSVIYIRHDTCRRVVWTWTMYRSHSPFENDVNSYTESMQSKYVLQHLGPLIDFSLYSSADAKCFFSFRDSGYPTFDGSSQASDLSRPSAKSIYCKLTRLHSSVTPAGTFEWRKAVVLFKQCKGRSIQHQ